MLPLILTVTSVFMLVLTVFVAASKKINKLPPQGSPLVDASKTIKIALKEKSFHKAKPSMLRENQRLDMYAFAQSAVYTDSYVEQVKSGLLACKVRHPTKANQPSLLTLTQNAVFPSFSVLYNLLDSDLQQLDFTSW